MGERVKVFTFIALLGFIAGVMAELAVEYVVPAILRALPLLLNVRYILSGLAGAFLALVLVSIWAYITGPSRA